MVCLGILWNCIEEHIEEVKEDVCKYGEIVEVIPLNLGDDYESFVRDIYAQDSIAEWKVNKKLETMFSCSDSRSITALIMKIDTTTQRYHEYKKRMVYENLEDMKTNIRKKYSEKIPYYFFDNIFHVTDDENEFKQDYEVLKSYILKKGNEKQVYLVKKKEIE